MKILLLGSLISAEQMEKINNHSKEKASVAPVNYESMLVKGLFENGVDVEALSIPAVAAFPNSEFIRIKGKTELLYNTVNVKWVPFLNLQGLKQLSIKYSVERLLKKWLVENKHIKEKAVLMYSIYPPYSEPAIKLCREFGCHISAVITDLPEYMYTWKNMRGLRGWYSKRISEQMLSLQGKCDSYILFTKPMANKMQIENKPYIVSEGFCDEEVFSNIPEQKKNIKKTVLYGGNLSKLYGIRNLVEAFMQIDSDAELHLYGAGADSEYVELKAKEDKRIKFYGRVSREKLLCEIKKAHLLVINKPTDDDYSNYSFSSKILEYMVSGTPVLTTKVGGMPEEYYDFFYFIDDESIEGLSRTLNSILNFSETELNEYGKRAAKFAKENKNYKTQGEKVVEFISSCLK